MPQIIVFLYFGIALIDDKSRYCGHSDVGENKRINKLILYDKKRNFKRSQLNSKFARTANRLSNMKRIVKI